MPTLTVEIGSYESGRVVKVEVPEVTYETTQQAHSKGIKELEKLVDTGEFDEQSHVVQIWHGQKCLYDFMNGFGLYWPEHRENMIQMGSMKVTKLEPFLQQNHDKNGCIRPLLQDHYNMGTSFGKNVMVLYSYHNHEECRDLIVVDCRSGDRIRITFQEEKKEEDDRWEFRPRHDGGGFFGTQKAVEDALDLHGCGDMFGPNGEHLTLRCVRCEEEDDE